ncbi:MAG: biopolymer transporter ExbD [Proteobacteria bacterium]|nr:biopolymer transporter ExbD [Pseudomonadota bacterium]MBU1714268.1 biopolymer transporter ExbD [Pseudomonadota bacterium]
MKFRRKDPHVENIDVSPLIDMVFILLIFFMVSTTFVKDLKLDLDRPSAASASLVKDKVIRVHIDKNRDIFIDNQAVKIWAIQAKLREMLRHSVKKSVLVITDTAIPVEALIDLVDECRMSGADDVAVATNKELG